ncbi:MAG: gluconate kinase [Rubrobacter sp.]|nr:gluconate kinase [Rubrobacter sp.]
MEETLAFVGVDIGTTSVKAVAFDRRGETLADEDREYPLRSSRRGRAEQDPEEILTALLDTLGKVVGVLKERGVRVGCVSFSAAMHSLMGLDGDGNPLTPSIIWADNRAAGQARRIRDEMDGLAIHRRTGTPIHPMSPLAKLLWFREEDPDTFGAAARWVSVKEYVLSRLFGEFVVDHSIASASGLFNLEGCDWDGGALRIAGLSPEKLSRPVPTTHVMDGLLPEYAEKLGLERDTPFVVGANDGALANLGVGAVDPGMVAVSIGTSGAVRSIVRRPEFEEGGRLFCYALDDDAWVIGGPINNGGIALQWLRDSVFPELARKAEDRGEDAYDLMGGMAGEIPAGSEGLIFLPYLTGERAPHWNAAARATFFGLTRSHGNGHMIRAVMEGVAFQLHAVERILAEVAGEPREVRATGGFAHSALWRQMLADIFGHEILFPEGVEGSSLGAAMLGMKAIGEIRSLEAAGGMVGISHRHQPNRANAEIYAQLMEMFVRLYDRLEPEFEALDGLDLPSGNTG